jgi:hypothetical protein
MPRYCRLFLSCLLLCTLRLPAQTPAELPATAVSLQDLSAFRPTGGNWKIAGDVFYDLGKGGAGKTSPGAGVVVNDPAGKAKDHLLTTMEHGDIDLDLDFMMDKGSNAGVYLQGRYEIQMFDSWGVARPKSSDCGAIYERWDESRPEGRKGYEGHPPAQNVSRAPGLWQHFRIIFRAPRFNAQGQKIANARFVKVIHNGVTIHENVEVTGPTRSAAFTDEKPDRPADDPGRPRPGSGPQHPLQSLRHRARHADRHEAEHVRRQVQRRIRVSLRSPPSGKRPLTCSNTRRRAARKLWPARSPARCACPAPASTCSACTSAGFRRSQPSAGPTAPAN